MHVFQSCPKDSVAVTAILQVLVTLKEQRPELEKVYCKQDIAGCNQVVQLLLEAHQPVILKVVGGKQIVKSLL